MCKQSQFIEQQRELYERQLDEVGTEAWRIAHQQAMECFEIQDAISFGLSILAGIRRRNERWAQDVQNGTVAFSWDDARHLADWYRWWLERSRILLDAISACEKHDFKVEGSEPFREACRDVTLMSLDIDRVRGSVASLEEGRGTPLAQAMHELRDRLRG